MYRQGDVLLVPVDKIRGRGEVVKEGRIVLALGEATGHAHVLEAPGIRAFDDAGRRYLEVPPEGGRLAHEEHGGIDIPGGTYRVVIQREYEPRGTRSVAD